VGGLHPPAALRGVVDSCPSAACPTRIRPVHALVKAYALRPRGQPEEGHSSRELRDVRPRMSPSPWGPRRPAAEAKLRRATGLCLWDKIKTVAVRGVAEYSTPSRPDLWVVAAGAGG
jgi:hypothetical protein